MAGLDDVLKNLPIDEIAAKLGVDGDTAQKGILEGGQAILAGLGKQTQSPERAASLEKALAKHAGEKKIASASDIDVEDGRKILGHIFSGEQETVAKQLTASEKTAGGIDFGQLLPILAPIIMNLIANKKTEAKEAPEAGGLDLGSLIGGLLGGGSDSRGGGIDLGAIGGLIGGLFGKK